MAGNSLAFHKLTPESLYWLGWMATDGCVHWQNGWKISLELQEADKALIERFSKFIGGTEPKQRKGKRSSWYTSLGSSIMGSKLLEYGIKQRKSSTLLVSPELARSPHFWRGAIEGDGSITEYELGNLKVELSSGSHAFIEQFKLFYPNATVKPNQKKWRAYCCCSHARRLLKLLYDGSYPDLVLERKQPLVRKWTR